MSKIYLQEKITPVANKYIIVGQDGNLTTGDLPTGTFPTLTIKVPNGAINVTVSQGVITLPITQIDAITWVCNPSAFGIWTASCMSDGSTLTDTINIAEIKSYSIDLRVAVRSILNDNSWEVIQRVAQQSLGSTYWSIGDKKAIEITGNIGNRLTLDHFQGYVFIVDFDHNPSIEGFGITFQGFKDTEDRCVLFHITPSSGSGYSDGPTWKDGNLRNRYIAQDPVNLTANTLMTCLPDELRVVLKPTVKYSWNNLNDLTSTGISATTDYLFVPSLYEMFDPNDIKVFTGDDETDYKINSVEANYCTRYSYYSNVDITYQNNDNTNTIIATSNVEKLRFYRNDSISNYSQTISRTGMRIDTYPGSGYIWDETAAGRAIGVNSAGTLAEFVNLSRGASYWYFSYFPQIMFVVG